MRRDLAATALLTAIALAAGCGGDDGPDSSATATPTAVAGATFATDDAAYFTAMVPVFEQVHTEAEAIRAALQEGLATGQSEDERRSAIEEYAAAYIAYADSAKAQFEAVVPTHIATGQHAALIAAAAGLQQLGGALQTAIQENQPSDQAGFNAVLFAVDGSTLEQRLRDACNDLQAAATAQSVEVDYQCTR